MKRKKKMKMKKNNNAIIFLKYNYVKVNYTTSV